MTIVNQGKYTVDEKLELFDKFNDGIISINGVPHIKIVRYDKHGYQSLTQGQHNFWDYFEDRGWDWPENSSMGEIEGCFAFARFEDKWALTGVENEFTIKYVTYIPLDTEVYIRNGIKDKPEHTLVVEEGNHDLTETSFVKLPIYKMLDRMKALEEYVQDEFKDRVNYKNDGLTHSRYCEFRACEIVLPKEVIEKINNEYYLFVFPNENIFLDTNMNNAKIIYTLFNKGVLPVMEKNNIVIQLSIHVRALMLYLKQDEYLYFRPRKDNRIIVIEGRSHKSTLSKPFYEIAKEVLIELKIRGYAIEFEKDFKITDSSRSMFSRKGDVKLLDFNINEVLNYRPINEKLLTGISEMLKTCDNENHKQAVINSLQPHEKEFINI